MAHGVRLLKAENLKGGPSPVYSHPMISALNSESRRLYGEMETDREVDQDAPTGTDTSYC